MNSLDLELVFRDARSIRCEPLQDIDEMSVVLQQILYMVPKARVVVELGVANGGWLYLVHAMCDSLKKMIGVDIDLSRVGKYLTFYISHSDMCEDAEKLSLVEGNSQDLKTMRQVEELLEGREIDVLHIDAKHSYDSANLRFG